MPADLKTDFEQAGAILETSPKASAALSRRGVQHVLREYVGAKGRTLKDEMDAAIASGRVPDDIARELHAVRKVGNYAAHPTKDENTGAIVDVEPDEAKYTLSVFELLLEHYISAPKRREQIRAKVDTKSPEKDGQRDERK